MDEYEILQFIEQSGGVSPYWLPKATPAGMIKFPKMSKGGLDKTDKMLLAIGIVVLVVALGIIIYRYDKKQDKLFAEKIKKFKEEEIQLKKQPELKPEENVGK